MLHFKQKYFTKSLNTPIKRDSQTKTYSIYIEPHNQEHSAFSTFVHDENNSNNLLNFKRQVNKSKNKRRERDRLSKSCIAQ